MKSLIILFFFFVTFAHSINPFRWGHYKPHLIYSLSEEDLQPITVRMAFGYKYKSIPIRYDLNGGDETNLVLDYNYNNGRDFSEQTIYDKSSNFQFKAITIKEQNSWSIYLKNPDNKGFVNKMLTDLLKKLSMSKSSDGLFNEEGFMENDHGLFSKNSNVNNEEVVFGFSIGLEQLKQHLDIDIKNYYIMKAEDVENSFLIRNKSNHEIISVLKLKVLEAGETKPTQFSYKFIKRGNKYENWHLGEDLKTYLHQDSSSELEENSIDTTAVLLKIPVKLSKDFIIQLLYQEDLTFSLADHYDILPERLQTRRFNFLEDFIHKFPVTTSPQYMQCSMSSLSNLIGGLSYMYGPIKTSKNPSAYTYSKPLFTMTPCRNGFARGFLWDEGFHNMILAQYDQELSLKSITHWLETVIEETGWLPREQIRGPEVEQYANRDFLVQNEMEANPPTLIIPLSYLFQQFKKKGNIEGLEEIKKVWRKAKLWFDWFHTSQRDTQSEEYIYHWVVERNGFNLGSGMDDYPRNDPRFSSRFHLDLQVWNIVFAEGMLIIMEDFETDEEAKNQMRTIILKSKENLHQRFKDPLDLLYKDTDGDSFSPHLGYDNLFPLMFGLIENNSQELKNLLEVIRDEGKLWSQAGIRSLSRSDAYYRQNDNYWTSPIWVNINYMVLRGLKKFYWEDENAQKLYNELRENLMRTICGQWKNSGYFWETFDDGSASGTHHSLFSGWTSLVTLIISEKYI